MTITKRSQILSDGSEVFDLELSQGDQRLVLHTYGELSAIDLAEQLRHVIGKYTCDSVVVR